MLPFPQLWASLFFVMLFLLGVDSMVSIHELIIAWFDEFVFFQFVQIEAIISSILDVYPRLRTHKRWITLGTCFAMFVLSISCTTHVIFCYFFWFEWQL